MTDSELLAIVEAEERQSLGYGDGELNTQREKALKYYNAEPYGDEQEGRSQIVTTEVADTVEWVLPSLLKIFATSDKAVEFRPERPADAEAAKQATEAVNYVFYRQNNGFLALYTFFKDALLTKNGYIKVYYEQTERRRKETYRGLTEPQMVMLTMKKGVTVVAGSSYPDPLWQPQGMEGEAPPNLYDVTLEVTEPYGKACVVAIPPEEVLISKSHNSVDLRDADFVAHRSEKSVSDLIEMGYDKETLMRVPTSDDGWLAEATPEYSARREFDEEETGSDKIDPAMRKVWVTEAYIRVDYDGDGVAELRKVVKAGREVLENEEIDLIPIASITPTIMTHRHIGKSVADWVMDLQLLKSTLTRQVLDNIYLTNSPRKIVLADPSTGAPRANLEDLLSVRVGGVLREYVPNAIRPEQTPFMGQYGLQVMEYLDAVRENRTGVTRYNQGVDADSLNKTATGISAIMTASQQRIELIARVFAETGVSRIFQLILHCIVKYGSQRPITMRLRDEWVEYDPSNWSDQMDMTVNVGLGTGNKDQQLVHLQQIAMAQVEAVKMGAMGLIVTPKNIYNTQAKIIENAGFKNVEEFWTDPQDRMPEPKPDPKIEIERAKLGLDKQRMEIELQMEGQRGQQEMAMEREKHQFEMQREMEKAEMQRQVEQQKFEMEQQRHAVDINIEQEKAGVEMQNKAKAAEFDLEVKAKEEEAKQVKTLDEVTDRLAEVLGALAKSVNRLEQVSRVPRVAIKDPKTGTWRGELDKDALQKIDTVQ